MPPVNFNPALLEHHIKSRISSPGDTANLQGGKNAILLLLHSRQNRSKNHCRPQSGRVNRCHCRWIRFPLPGWQQQHFLQLGALQQQKNEKVLWNWLDYRWNLGAYNQFPTAPWNPETKNPVHVSLADLEHDWTDCKWTFRHRWIRATPDCQAGCNGSTVSGH